MKEIIIEEAVYTLHYYLVPDDFDDADNYKALESSKYGYHTEEGNYEWQQINYGEEHNKVCNWEKILKEQKDVKKS